jgi:hypothetical protein
MLLFLIGKAYTPNPYNFQMGGRSTHVERGMAISTQPARALIELTTKT